MLRGIAALRQFLGYDHASASQEKALIHASRDPDPGVRNNAVRALAVLAAASPKTGVKVPPAPFVDLLSSNKWTDRNKGAFALMSLTRSRDLRLLAELRVKAMAALTEMARWQDIGHAGPARILLGRIAGMDEAKLDAIAEHNEQTETIICAAQKVH